MIFWVVSSDSPNALLKEWPQTWDSRKTTGRIDDDNCATSVEDVRDIIYRSPGPCSKLIMLLLIGNPPVLSFRLDTQALQARTMGVLWVLNAPPSISWTTTNWQRTLPGKELHLAPTQIQVLAMAPRPCVIFYLFLFTNSHREKRNNFTRERVTYLLRVTLPTA